MPWIPLAVAGVGLGAQVYGAIAGGNAEKEAQQAQQRMDNLKAARERTNQIRQMRAARAQVLQRGANQGAGMSSGAAGGAATAAGEAYGNIQYIGFEQQTGEALSIARQKEINAQGTGAIGTAFENVGMTVFNNRDELGAIFGDTSKQ